ncbi:hypothetical protein GGI42DRAFT_156638 [Trichoderma sp. SZMC 28013]
MKEKLLLRRVSSSSVFPFFARATLTRQGGSAAAGFCGWWACRSVCDVVAPLMETGTALRQSLISNLLPRTALGINSSPVVLNPDSIIGKRLRGVVATLNYQDQQTLWNRNPRRHLCSRASLLGHSISPSHCSILLL